MANFVAYTNRCCPNCSYEKFEQIGEKIRCLSCGAEWYPGSLKPVSHDNNGTPATSSSMPQPDFSKPSVDLNCPTSPAQPLTPISPSTPKMNFCPNCGFKLLGPSKFCPNCGNPLGVFGAPQVATEPASVRGGSADSGMAKDDLVSCLALYAENLQLIEKALSGLFCDSKETRPLVNWTTFSLEEHIISNLWKKRFQLLEKVSAADISAVSPLDQYRLITIYIPILKSVLFEPLPLSIAKSLYPSFMKAQSTYRESYESLDGELVRMCFGTTSEIIKKSMWNHCSFFDRRMTESDFISICTDSTQLEKLHKELGFFSDIKEDFAAGKDSFLRFSHEELQKTTVGFFSKREETRTVSSYESSFDVSDFHKLLIEKMTSHLFYQKDVLLNKTLPAIFASLTELIQNMRPLVEKFPLPMNYRTSADALALARILTDGKADNWKEAINLYDTQMYRKQVLGSLADIKQELYSLKRTVNAYGTANLAVSASLLGQMKSANALLAEQKKKLSSIATSTLITAVFGN